LDTAGGVAALSKLISKQAMMIGFLNDFVFLVGIAAIGIPLVFLLRRNKGTEA